MRRLVLGLLLTALLAVSVEGGAGSAPTPSPGVPGWTIEPVATFGGSSPPQLAVGTDGVPQVLYCPVGQAWWANRSDAGWLPEYVAATPGGGGCGALAVGPDGAPRVYVYSKPVVGPAAAMLWTRTPAGWTPSPGTVPSGSIAVDSQGRVHMVAEEAVPNGTAYDHYLHFAVLSGGVWQVTRLDFMGTTGFAFIGAHWEQVVVDSQDNPRVLYYDQLRGDVRYASRNETGWRVEVVEHIGALNIAGREGSLALDVAGNPHAAYTVRTGPRTSEVRYAVRGSAGWASEAVSRPPPAYGGGGLSPSVAVGAAGPVVLYGFNEQLTAIPTSFNYDLIFAAKGPSGWEDEIAYDGHLFLNVLSDPSDDDLDAPQFPAMVLDHCGNPHAAVYLNNRVGAATNSGVYYLTKGECSPSTATASLRVEPRTMNLKSQGRWVTATVTVDGATAADVDLSSLVLNGVPAAWARRLNDTTLLAKFPRAEVAATLPEGKLVTLTLTGSWNDGEGFTATDAIRVIRPGR